MKQQQPKPVAVLNFEELDATDGSLCHDLKKGPDWIAAFKSYIYIYMH